MTVKSVFYEYYTGRTFESTMEDVLDAEYQFNRLLIRRGSVTLNDLLVCFGLPLIEAGDDVVWARSSLTRAHRTSVIPFSHETYILDDGLECRHIRPAFEPTSYPVVKPIKKTLKRRLTQ